MTARLTRSRFLGGLGTIVAGLALAPGSALARRNAPRLVRISVGNGGRPYAGDRRLFATVSPGVAGRDTAVVRFELLARAHVRLDVIRTALRRRTIVATTGATLDAGERELTWTPAPDTPVGTYVLRLTVEAPGHAPRVYGGQRPSSPERGTAPVVRILGVEAACNRRSYAPGELIALSILADARRLTLQVLHSGPEPQYSSSEDTMNGLPVGRLVTLPWKRNRDAATTVRLLAGDWPTGVYAARLTTKNGRVGFAPFVLRPEQLGAFRQAVVMPTNTWQAYNFYDEDGDGFGDTWYAGGNPPVVVTRPYRESGVPPRFHRYDAPFLQWLSRTGKTPDFLAEDDLDGFASGDELRRLYDLIVFPGHTEYVTAREYDVVQRFRDLGGRLIFLSADNFYWRVDRIGNALHRREPWRSLRRPEASVLGAQYRANDDGKQQGVYFVTDATLEPWLWAGTGLTTGSTFGATVGGYGIEIDARAPSSPPGTQVLAVIPNLYGPGVDAEMTYYETAAGARVFAAGTLDFGGSVLTWPVRRLLENLWQHMTS